MAKKLKNRGANTGTEQAQQGPEQEIDESNDQGTLSEELTDESGDGGVDSTDSNADEGGANAEGSDSVSEESQFEEGLVGDETDAPNPTRGATAFITPLEELPFLPPVGDEPATPGVGAELQPEQAPGIEVVITSPDLSDIVQVPVKPLTEWSVPELRAELVGKVGEDAAAAWSREQMLTFFETGAYPNKTTRGNWIYDARRTHNTKAWSASEIHDFIDGKLLLDRSVDEHLVWEEAYARYRAPTNWTVEAFRQFVCDGTRPDITASGVLIEDRMRDQKQAHHLTFRELRAAALGDIEVPHEREVVLGHLRKRLGLSENHSEERMLSQLPAMTNEVSMDNTFLQAKLEEYKAAMTRNPATLSEETAGAAQGMLYEAIRKVIKREFNEFVEGWNIILDFVNENYVALFDPYKARRGWSQVALGKQQLALFEDLLSLIIRTREPGNRAEAAKLYNLEIVLRHMPNENERQNLFLYYTAA